MYIDEVNSLSIINPIPAEDIDFILLQKHNEFVNFPIIGEGSNGTVHHYKNYAIKYSDFITDGDILKEFQDNPLFPKLYFYTKHFMVVELIKMHNKSTYDYFEKNVDTNISALDIYSYCFDKGFIPYDIHEQNIVVTKNEELKFIDVGGFVKYDGPKHYTIHNILMNNEGYRNEYIELDNIIEHVKRPPIAI